MRLSKKLAFAAVSTVAAVGIATSAFAYWTTTGGGSASAISAASNGTLILHASVPGNLAPGQSGTVTFTADNGSDTDLQVGTVHSVVSTSDTNCLPGWFSIGDVAENQTIAHKQNGVALSSSGTLYFNNAAANQDSCKNATVTLTLSS